MAQRMRTRSAGGRTAKMTAAKSRKVAKKTAKKASKRAPPRKQMPRDPRLPAPGTTLVRPYKGRDYAVTVLEDSFEWEGQTFTSLSKLASAITGQKSINGFLWMRLTEPKGRKAKTATG